jgi:hypothetical protein
MKKISFLLLFLFIYNFLYSQTIKKDTTNQPVIWTWKGIPINEKTLMDSLRVFYLNYVDSVKSKKNNDYLSKEKKSR